MEMGDNSCKILKLGGTTIKGRGVQPCIKLKKKQVFVPILKFKVHMEPLVCQGLFYEIV